MLKDVRKRRRRVAPPPIQADPLCFSATCRRMQRATKTVTCSRSHVECCSGQPLRTRTAVIAFGQVSRRRTSRPPRSWRSSAHLTDALRAATVAMPPRNDTMRACFCNAGLTQRVQAWAKPPHSRSARRARRKMASIDGPAVLNRGPRTRHCRNRLRCSAAGSAGRWSGVVMVETGMARCTCYRRFLKRQLVHRVYTNAPLLSFRP